MIVIIVIIAMVKNEEDIIESFIRYNSTVADRFVIVDNGSTDHTLSILGSLIDEGYQIEMRFDVSEFNQIKIMNDLLYSVIKTLKDTDYIIPLDSDEFIVGEGENDCPVSIIQALDQNKVWKVVWRTYIPSKTEKKGDFVPYTMNETRSRETEIGEKMIIPARMVHSGFVMNNGNHDASSSYSMDVEVCDRLRVAHFPIRSKDQFLVKCVAGYINRLITSTYVKGRSRHIENAFYDIKTHNGTVTLDMIRYHALNYCTKNVSENDIRIERFSSKYCGHIELLYTDFDNDTSFMKILSVTEQVAELYRQKNIEGNEKEKPFLVDAASESLRAIEQYSFVKMRKERQIRDYYQIKCELLQRVLVLEKLGVNVAQVLKTYIQGKTLLVGYNSISLELYRTCSNVIGFIDNPIETMLDVETYDLATISYVGVDTIMLFDYARKEELLSKIRYNKKLLLVSVDDVIENLERKPDA